MGTTGDLGSRATRDSCHGSRRVSDVAHGELGFCRRLARCDGVRAELPNMCLVAERELDLYLLSQAHRSGSLASQVEHIIP